MEMVLLNYILLIDELV